MSGIVLNISVHQLVDFLLRKGDIDNRIFNSETMQEGTKVHKNFQNKQNELYLQEVDLKASINLNDFIVELRGRADGIILTNPIMIDEIKSTNSNLVDFSDDNEEWHLGQAECYAYMYAKKHDLKEIDVRLTYLSQNNKKHLNKIYSYDFKDLEARVLSYIKRYISFYSIILKHNKEKINSIKTLDFPFPLRTGQESIIKLSKESIIYKDSKFIEASTGLGKTISVLYGALKGSIEKNVDKLFFLCAKNSGFKSVNTALEDLNNKGLILKSVEILAKEKMCLLKNHDCEPDCNPDVCPFAKEYYSKLFDVIVMLLNKHNNFTSEYIYSFAKENKMCPFELSLDISSYCDLIIADYNYIFHPISYLKRFFDAVDYKYSKFLMVDEAHNLIHRSREMYSASLSYYSFEKSLKDFSKIKNKSVRNVINDLIEDFGLFKKFETTYNNIILQTIDEKFIIHLMNYKKTIADYQKKHPKFKVKFSKDFSLDVFKFLTIFDYIGDNFVIYYNRENDKNFNLVIKCIDASCFIKNKVDSCDGTIFFSGTLTPIDYYKKSILGDDLYESKSFSSPFNKNNLLVTVNNDISVKYNSRKQTINDVVDNIKDFVHSKVGNYIVYVPSFEYLRLLQYNLNIDGNINVIYQNSNMSNDEKTNFLNNFEHNPKRTTVGICVLGGSFSEGVDLVEDRLIGVVIIGVGLPSVSFENNLIKDYYDKIGIDGFTYAYINPGINKIMQAVGRIIRSDNDRGVALLIDDRYGYKTYNFLFKNVWNNNKFINSSDSLKKELISFYKK